MVASFLELYRSLCYYDIIALAIQASSFFVFLTGKKNGGKNVLLSFCSIFSSLVTIRRKINEDVFRLQVLIRFSSSPGHARKFHFLIDSSYLGAVGKGKERPF
jgi:hypothetical protein